MELAQELSNTRNQFFGEITSLLEFVESTERSVKRRRAKSRFKGLNKSDLPELKKLVNFLSAVVKGQKPEKSSISVKSPRVIELLKAEMVPMRRIRFLAEMSLSYLISYQEAFLKHYLLSILISRRKLLKSNRQLTYEDVCNHKSMKSLLLELAQREVDALGFGSIDDFSEFFSHKFNISFSDFPSWTDLREATYRRHLIVHNRGVTNHRYCKAIGYKHMNKQLDTDMSYVRSVAEKLLEFVDFVHEKMLTKLNLNIRKSSKRQ